MIPKIIHFCWFGGNPLPLKVKKCIESWKKYCPEYRIIRWDESNFDISEMEYIKQAYDRRKYAFVADYVRLFAVEKFGGIYLDTDVELIKNLDDFLKYDAFFGMEEKGKVNTGIGFGAIRNSSIVNELKKLYNGLIFFDGSHENTKTCVEYAEPIFKSLGLKEENKLQFFDNKSIAIFSTDFFCPQSMENGKISITENTYSIHHYDASWKKHPFFDRYSTRIKIKIHKFVNFIFGEGTYEKIKEKIHEEQK